MRKLFVVMLFLMGSSLAGFAQNPVAPIPSTNPNRPQTVLLSGAIYDLPVGPTFTVPVNVRLRFDQGATLNTAGKTITVNGLVDAGAYEIFRGNGTVRFSGTATPVVRPEWWGCKPDGVTDCYVAIQAAIASVNEGGEVYFDAGVYKFSNTLTIDTSITNSVSAKPNFIQLRGRGRFVTFLVHSGTQTTGALLGKSAITWTGSYYNATGAGMISAQDLAIGSNYGPAMNFQLVGYLLRSVWLYSGGTTTANLKIDGGGGDSYDSWLDSSGVSGPDVRFSSLVLGALPMGATTNPLNILRISTGTYNDGTHGANSGAIDHVHFFGAVTIGAVTGNSIWIGKDSAAYSQAPINVKFVGCELSGAVVITNPADPDYRGPAVVKLVAGTNIHFDNSSFEPGYAAGGIAGISFEQDSIIGQTEAYIDGGAFGGGSGYVDIGHYLDTTTARPYKASLHLTHSGFESVRMNSKMLSDGNILDVNAQDNHFASDWAGFADVSLITNYSSFDNFYGSATTRTATKNNNYRNSAAAAASVLPVVNGGTGASSFTANCVVMSAGSTAALTATCAPSGLTSASFGTNPATSGAVRLANNLAMCIRDAGNTTNYCVVTVSSGNDTIIGPTSATMTLAATSVNIDTDGDIKIAGHAALKHNGNSIELQGSTTNDSASAGKVGEYVESTVATGSSVSLASGSATPITSITLTAGEWEVGGTVDYTPNAATSITNLAQGYNATNNCMTNGTGLGGQDTFTRWETAANVIGATDPAWNIPNGRQLKLASTTTVCLISNSAFSVNTLKAYGTIWARRVR